MDDISARNDRLMRRLQRENPELFAYLDRPERHPILAHPGIEWCLALPGYPVDGYECFMQPPDGPVMLRVSTEDHSAFVWFDAPGHVLMRPWSPQMDAATDTITSATSLDSALDSLLGSLAARGSGEP